MRLVKEDIIGILCLTLACVVFGVWFVLGPQKEINFWQGEWEQCQVQLETFLETND